MGLVAAAAALIRASTMASSSAVFPLDQPAKGVPKSPGSTNAPLAMFRHHALGHGRVLREQSSKQIRVPGRSRGPHAAGRSSSGSPGMVQVDKSSESFQRQSQDQQLDNSAVGGSSVAGRPPNLPNRRRRGRALAFQWPWRPVDRRTGWSGPCPA